MTKTRVLAALIMAPLAIGGVLFLPTPWLVAIAALLFLLALWEWLRLADVEDTLARTILLACNLALMVALVWGSRSAHGGSFALFQLVILVGVGWWLLALLCVIVIAGIVAVVAVKACPPVPAPASLPVPSPAAPAEVKPAPTPTPVAAIEVDVPAAKDGPK